MPLRTPRQAVYSILDPYDEKCINEALDRPWHLTETSRMVLDMHPDDVKAYRLVVVRELEKAGWTVKPNAKSGRVTVLRPRSKDEPAPVGG